MKRFFSGWLLLLALISSPFGNADAEEPAPAKGAPTAHGLCRFEPINVTKTLQESHSGRRDGYSRFGMGFKTGLGQMFIQPLKGVFADGEIAVKYGGDVCRIEIFRFTNS